MQYISRLILVVSLLLAAQATVAQPPARQKDNANKPGKAKNTTAVTGLSERAKSQYPGTITPQEVEWKRDIYRELDLSKEKNASLYYPVEPMGESMNLFTFLFENIIEGNITAYEYSLDGYESFSEEKAVDPKLMLDDYRIYYEEENGALLVSQSDIPSAQVLSYYIKESNYYDQRTATYNRRITALCPVLHRSGEFTTKVTKYPMFWLNFDEISPLLNNQKVMSSSYNNVSTMTMSDYFLKNSYEGEIYKTVNLQNLAINQYCKNDSAIKKEQKNIEQQLTDFRGNLWKVQQPQEKKDTAAVAASDSISSKSAVKEEPKAKRTTKKSSDSQTAKKSSTAKSGSKSGAGPRVSVRRTRR